MALSLKILVTGAAGQIGKQVTKYLVGFGYEVIPVDCMDMDDVFKVDLRNESATRQLIHDHAPNLIIHLAALKNIAFCEANKEASRVSNYGITELLSSICLESNTRFIFFSTDYVFGNRKQPWKETDLTCPSTTYGSDKADSERLIQQRLTNFAIIRTAQLYGFPGDFVHHVWDTLKAKEEFQAIDNLVNCPTWASDLLSMLHNIIQHEHQGVFHCVGPEPVSRYQYACKIAHALNLDITLIKRWSLDFSEDIRPSVVHLDGTFTYNKLRVYPKNLRENLSLGTLT